jgi:hypothetical protein
MIKIVITSPEVKELKGLAKVSQKPYHMRIQTGYAFTVDKAGVVGQFPDKFEFNLDDDQSPYLRGEYMLSPSAVFVGRDGHMEMRPRLVPITSKAA